MKNMNRSFPILLVSLTVLFSSCEIVETIFKAGFWSAILAVALVIGILLAIIFKSKS